VSALIHAATMVTAGVYMIGALNFLFAMAPSRSRRRDIGARPRSSPRPSRWRRTTSRRCSRTRPVSQLGYMFLAMGVGAYAAGIFHLMTHAFFKACLFLGSGSVIHAMGGEQDMRKMGGLREAAGHVDHVHRRDARHRGHPAARRVLLEGRDPLAGLSSPHGSRRSGRSGSWSRLTAFYMFRQVFMVFFGECRAHHECSTTCTSRRAR
jgi:NADH-quinone oxidoreductase subunit L